MTARVCLIALCCLIAEISVAWEVYRPMGDEIEKLGLTDDEWRERLTAEQFRVLREKGTERAGSGEYDKFYEAGVYCCGACGLPLFSSEHKFDSGTGWPSYWAPYDADHVYIQSDYILFYRRDEVLCARCDSHIGHVFNDGPPPTEQRWCMNSVALRFVPEAEFKKIEEKKE